jgi:3-oxoacyl-[acyl-carrier-protein] synthase III
MAQWTVSDIRISGIASAIPEGTQGVADLARQFGADEVAKITDSVGVQTRHVASSELCASDLCFAAAERLLEDLGWERDSVDALIFVSQTPDYVMPATACSLHGRLGLGSGCLAFDVSLGCSGYVYGLGVASRMLGAGAAQRALVLVGDTITRVVSPQDRSAAPLFGDAGTATAMEYSEGAPAMFFDLGTDGAGQKHLIVPAGGFRNRGEQASSLLTERENGNVRSDNDLFMNGGEVFLFTLSKVPALVKRTLKGAGWSTDDIDGLVLHQANAFMLNHLKKRLKLSDDRMVIALEQYGNTSCASIPLAITHTWATNAPEKPLRLILGGFGVGWSWGGAAVTCENMVLPELIVVPDPAASESRSETAEAA